MSPRLEWLAVLEQAEILAIRHAAECVGSVDECRIAVMRVWYDAGVDLAYATTNKQRLAAAIRVRDVRAAALAKQAHATERAA